jgi:Arc/MetJ-type ribon-helix-helix transcriptional regulator
LARKVATSITIDKELLDWIDKEIKKKRFASRSHAFEYAIMRLKEE